MSWSRQQVELLIEGFQNNPCLCDVKAKNYKNKYARNEALKNILEMVLPIKKDVTINDLKTKWNGLRTNFLHEHKKVIGSTKSGCGKDEASVDTIEESRLSIDTIEVTELDDRNYEIAEDNFTENIYNDTDAAESTTSIVVHQVSDAIDQDGYIIPVLSPTSSESTSKERSNERKQAKKRRAVPEMEFTIIENAATAISNITNVSEKRGTVKQTTLIAGEYIVSKLADIKNENLRNEAEFEIIKLLHEYVNKDKIA
ncbi:Alcohol dehydrogenase transcription factor Myb/SANT-like [Popillia japonica]|uniref:Alcohol dehydrogenase transcription factor Myb/SANT-like n=1 Tax=Popillia japonica TaxID=7064 RepID=A0AAW1KJB7_POPJA